MTTEAQRLVEYIAESHEQYLLEADDLLRAIALEGRQPTLGERTFFLRECGLDETAVKSQLRRMSNVVRLEPVAGSAADREAAAIEASTAAAVLEKEGPKLREKIEKLEQQLSGLERDQRLSAKRVEDQAAAVDQLRKLVPLFVVERVREDVRLVEQSLGDEIRTGGVRKNELECCLEPSRYPSENAWLESLQRSFREAVVVGEINKMITRQLSPEWAAIRESIEAELQELNARLAELQVEYDQRMAEATAPLNHYAG